MRNPGGYLIHMTEKGTKEFDTFTCAHCNCVTIVMPKQDAAQLGGFCTMCGALICSNCSTRGCAPFEKQLDMIEKRDRLLRSVGI